MKRSEWCKVSTSTEDGVLIVKMSGKMAEMHHVKEIAEAITAELLDGHKGVLIDLESVSYINSTGFRLLAMVLNESGKLGRKVVVCGLQTKLESVFRGTGFEKLVQVRTDRAEAMWEFNDQ